MPEPQPHLPLAGLLVITLEQAIAAPLCTRHLADFGARVIKIEPPGQGDFTRHYDEVVHGLAAHFVWVSRGKESLTLDLKSEAGNALLHRLLVDADVLVSNLGPGAVDRLGLGAEELAERYPRLITATISGYGTGGTLDHKRAYDLLAQAEAGSCAITGWPGQPAKPGIPIADVGTAMYAYSSILAALYDRERTGRGTAIAVSLFDTVIEFMGYALNHARHSGHDQPPNGLSSPSVAPYGAYPTSDGHTVVLGTTNDGEWRRLAGRMLGRDDLAADSRYAHNAGRLAHRAELDEQISAWCSARPLAEVQAAADAAGIGNARYNMPSEVVTHPHLASRDRWRDVDSPVGPIPALLPPPVVAGWEPRMGAIPGLGAHTDQILAELGFSLDEVDDLRRGGVV
ncbi:MAG TPA: CaiB/BaiF CoA-transferase family protein [Pseudonocardia sp.]|uniref:CaiB/BaiF CoA transferase family protein n=1 Tax=Pseudonocardia sp. TaxID=60912 RepID=UPI002EDB656E